MSVHYHYGVGLQGYGPDAENIGRADSLEDLSYGLDEELRRAEDYCEEEAYALADAREFEEAWNAHMRAENLSILRRNLSWDRAQAPLYAGNLPLWEETFRGLVEETFPVDIGGYSSLYVWECQETECEEEEEES